MQKSLSAIDGHARSNNIIITGLPESEIISGQNDEVNNIILQNDTEKVKYLLKSMRYELFSDDDINRFDINRIGKTKDGYNRVVRVKLASTHERNEFMKNARILKNLNEPWKLIYFKKDLHPVYLSENNRIQKKLRQLKDDLNNGVKYIENGVLLVCG